MPERVLILYEDAYLAKVLGDALRRAFVGLDVMLAETVDSALDLLRRSPPNVVLTGVSSYIDGWKFLKESRGHPATKTIPFVALSTDVGTWQKERDLFDAGFAVVLALPFGPHSLISAVEAFLPKASAARKARDRRVARKSDPLESALKRVRSLLSRFHAIARLLRQRHDSRPTLEVEDEYDVQDLLRALLSLNFDDIRPEEGTPSHAGGASRADFLLKREKVVIEVKKTRKGLTAKKIGEELLVDRERYAKMRDCKALVCFVYDPDSHLVNPKSLQADLSGTKDGIRVEVIVTPNLY